MLEQLQADHEGFGAGPLAALKQSQHVLGSLADKIRVPDQYVTAIETALGHHLQLVLTEQPESARQILADLSANKTGRASIAPLAFVRQRHAVSRGCPQGRSTAPAPGAARRSELNGVPLPRHGGRRERGVHPPADGAPARHDAHRAGSERGDRRLAREQRRVPLRHAGRRIAELPRRLHRRLQQRQWRRQSAGFDPGPEEPDRRTAARRWPKLQEQVAEISRRKGALQSEQTELQASLQQAQTELRAQEVAIATHEGEFNALAEFPAVAAPEDRYRRL